MKKLLSLILGVCLIIPCAFLFTGCKDKPETKIETWDGTTLEVSVADADSNNVITIDTAEKLAGFAAAVNAGETFEEYTIRLACDMDMANKTWTPIGVGHRSKTANPFAGTFDGNGKKIIGLNNGDFVPNESYIARESDLIDEVYTYHYGFFGVCVGATIKNLELTVNFNCDSANLKGDSVGGLVGFSSGKLTIENCRVNGTIDGGFDSVGGLVGRAYSSSNTNQITIKNCVNNANVTADYKAAGILGFVSSSTLDATIDNCVNNGDVSVKFPAENNQNTSEIGAGGILGYISSDKKATLKNNFNFGTIESSKYAGQILGQNNNSSASTYAGNYGLENNGNLGGNACDGVAACLGGQRRRARYAGVNLDKVVFAGVGVKCKLNVTAT